MQGLKASGFWAGGRSAWWLGLRDAIRSQKDCLATAKSEEERKEAQAALDRLQEQKADAEKNGHRWLF